MNIKSGISLFALSLALGCGGGGGGGYGGGSTPPPGPPANTVWVGGSSSGYGTGDSMSFTPAVLTVAAGTTVTFSWQGGTHSVSSYTLTTDSNSKTFTTIPDQSGGTNQVTFSTAGTYYYYCDLHGNFFGTYPNATQAATGMAGKIVVQ